MRYPLPDPARALVRQVAWFVAIGTFTTALYYGITAALYGPRLLDLVWASGVGYGVGSLVNFGLQRVLTFQDRSRRAIGGQFVVYWVLQGSSLVLNMALVGAFECSLPLPPAWVAPAAVVLTSGLVLVFNFVSHKWITFNPSLWGSPPDPGQA